MKKQYERPEVNVVEITFCSMLSTSLNIDEQSQGDFEEDFAGKRRGTWGNLWEEKN